MLAMGLSNPAWELSKEEARTIAESSANVARHYNATISPKVADWIVLGGVLATIYGSRLAPMVFARFSKKPQNKNQQATQSPQQTAQAPFDMPPLPTVGGGTYPTH
jgi:hypothetical protein